jgi:regulator of RNase E activity RraB
MLEIVRNRWNGYTYLFGDDERCIVSFDVTACAPEAQRPSQFRRVIGFSPKGHIGAQGLPSAESFARLKAIEDALIHQLEQREVRSWLVGRQVYRGFRELLFQVDDVEAFDAAYAVVEAEFRGMKLVEHPDWQFFNDKISPGLRGHNHIENREVIAALKRAGCDLANVFTLDHLFLGEPAALDAIENILAAEGFKDPSRDERSLTMRIDAPLDDQDEIDAMTLFLRDVARARGAEYDGWGTAIPR